MDSATTVLQAIIVLSIVGFLLLGAEVFVPGLVLGFIGGISLAVAIGLGYFQYGALIGTLMLAGVGIIGTVGFFMWMAFFPRTAIGRRFINPTHLPSDFLKEKHPLLGKTGEAFSDLRPAGVAMIDGRKVDVVTEGAFIERGSALTVALVEGPRVVVRKNSLPQPSTTQSQLNPHA